MEGFQINRLGWWEKRSIKLEITEEDTKNIMTKLENFNENMPNLVMDLLNELAPRIAENLINSSQNYSKNEKRQREDFERNVWNIWKEPLCLLLVILDLAERACENAYVYSRMNDHLSPNLVEVLTRLHGRGVQVSQEIFVLLKSGYADGAMARWRTLHEIAVVASFISDNGDQCAKGYLDHQHVEIIKKAKLHGKNADRLGFQCIPDEENTIIAEKYDEVLKRYGQSFGEDYGWSAPYLKGKPNFSNIEKSVDLYFLRPFYQFACDHIHAGISGVLFKLGAPNIDSILAGPSEYGLSEPGQKTGITLCLLTSLLIQIFQSLDLLIAVQAMSLISQNACRIFSKIENSLIS